MKTLDDYREDHVELASIISDLRLMLTPEQLSIKPSANTTQRLLCDLFTKLKDHLKNEDKNLYPDLLVHDDAKIKSMAWGFISGEKSLSRMLNTYHKKWLKNCDLGFSEELVEETNEIFDLLLKRIEHEERVLFPRLEQAER